MLIVIVSGLSSYAATSAISEIGTPAGAGAEEPFLFVARDGHPEPSGCGRRILPSELSRRSHTESRRHGDQLGKRVCLHLAHHLASVGLYGDLADAKFSADLFVQQTRDD